MNGHICSGGSLPGERYRRHRHVGPSRMAMRMGPVETEVTAEVAEYVGPFPSFML